MTSGGNVVTVGLCCSHCPPGRGVLTPPEDYVHTLGGHVLAMQISGLHFNGCILCIRLQRAGIPCPKVVLLRKHVLIMSFIGQDTVPAPKLKEANLTPDQMNDAYKQCTKVSSKGERREEGGVNSP